MVFLASTPATPNKAAADLLGKNKEKKEKRWQDHNHKHTEKLIHKIQNEREYKGMTEHMSRKTSPLHDN